MPQEFSRNLGMKHHKSYQQIKDLVMRYSSNPSKLKAISKKLQYENFFTANRRVKKSKPEDKLKYIDSVKRGKTQRKPYYIIQYHRRNWLSNS